MRVRVELRGQGLLTFLCNFFFSRNDFFFLDNDDDDPDLSLFYSHHLQVFFQQSP